MHIANIDEFDKVWKLFHENKKWFPHVRKFHIRNRLNWGQVILENDVLITHQIYKRTGKIGHNTDVVTEKGSAIIHQIVRGKDGNAQETIKNFFEFIKTDVYLTVRKENTVACKFYEKVGMEQVGTISWSKGDMPGLVYKKNYKNT